jgi:predicted porin
MKKLLIAAAAMAVVAGAQAQSSVTVYGIIDAGYQSNSYQNMGGVTGTDKNRDVKGFGVGSAGAGGLAANRIGFRGTEDLGGGLKANFNYELAFNTSATGTDAAATNVQNNPGTSLADAAASAGQLQTNARTATVGIESAKLGRLDVGYALTSIHGAVAGHRAIAGTNLIGDLSYASDSTSSADQRIHANFVRVQGLHYTSPSVAGFTVSADVGNDSNRSENGTTTASYSTAQAVAVNYVAGALKVAVATGQAKEKVTAAATVGTNVGVDVLSAQYAVTPSITLDALYATRKQQNASSGAQTQKDDVTQVGIKYVVGKTTLAAMYGTGEGETTNASTGRKDRTGTMVGAIYELSKRTKAYATYGKIDAEYKADNVKETAKQVAVGLNHSF